MKNYVLLLLQCVLVCYLLFSSSHLFYPSVTFLMLQVVGGLLILWALFMHSVHKKEHAKGRRFIYWATEGPYEFLRHPIYAGLLLCVSGFVQEDFTLPRAVGFILLVVLVLMQIKSDERLNEVYFKHGYTKYKENTKKLVPYFY